MSSLHVRVTRRERQLAVPFTTARGRQDTVLLDYVELRDEQGHRGHGAAPTSEAMAATQAESLLRDCVAAIHELDASSLPSTSATIAAHLHAWPWLQASLDMAAFDMVGCRAGRSVRDLLGVANVSLGPSALALLAAPEADLDRRLDELRAWPILKVKISSGLTLDDLPRIRRKYPGRIWVDGNAQWAVADALRAAHMCADTGVELLEQPTRADDIAGLRTVHERATVPIVADESCRVAGDVAGLADCANAVNVKLHKCGGLLAARDMIVAAREHGLGVMLGCKTESAIGVTAVAQLAGLADYLDLDGHLDVRGESCVGLRIDRGTISLPDGPGLGMSSLDGGS